MYGNFGTNRLNHDLEYLTVKKGIPTISFCLLDLAKPLGKSKQSGLLNLKVPDPQLSTLTTGWNCDHFVMIPTTSIQFYLLISIEIKFDFLLCLALTSCIKLRICKPWMKWEIGNFKETIQVKCSVYNKLCFCVSVSIELVLRPEVEAFTELLVRMIKDDQQSIILNWLSIIFNAWIGNDEECLLVCSIFLCWTIFIVVDIFSTKMRLSF